jgi:DNA-binding response OmpR family regulator
MTNQRLVFGLGQFGRERRAALAAIAREAACQFEQSEDLRAISDASPHAILLDAADPDAEAAAIAMRGDSQLARIPIIVLCPEIGDLSFATAFTWGADDAVSIEKPRALTARLRALPREVPPSTPPDGRGAALIAESDPAHRVILGRVLRNAGYNVRFAVTAADAEEFAKDPELQLIVFSTDLDDAPRRLIEQIRQLGSTAICVVNTAPRTLRSCRNLLHGLERVTANDSYAPAENVLFLANDMRRTSRLDLRASARILYGTTVAFRGAGRHEDDYGFTYNVSSGGMYVRTLAVPEDDMVWLELCPPRAERRIRLVAQVQWRRRFGYNESATVPPGFGAKIVDGARTDLDAWSAGCATLADTLG